MSYHLAIDYFVDRGAAHFVEKEFSGIPQARKEAILPAVKYNLLVDALNISTALLVSAVALACLFSFSNALMLAGVGFLLRHVATHQRDKYFLPPNQPVQVNEGWLPWLIELVRKKVDGEQTKEAILFANLNMPKPKDFVINQKYLFGMITIEEKILVVGK